MNPNPSSRWRAALAALSLAILACNTLGGGATKAAPTSTPKAKSTATEAAVEPTQPPKPTKTPLAQATKTPDAPSPTPVPGPGDVLYFTDFDDLKDWTTVFAIPKSNNYTAEIRKGKLYLEVGDPKSSVYVFYDAPFEQADVRIDAAVETVGGPNKNNISLVCRATGDGWYEFSLNSGGLWDIWRYDKKGYTALKQGGSNAINLQKSKNVLSAVCQGDTLTLIINDVEIDSVTDDKFKNGQVGVSVSTFNLKGAEVEFDKLAVSIPK